MKISMMDSLLTAKIGANNQGVIKLSPLMGFVKGKSIFAVRQ